MKKNLRLLVLSCVVAFLLLPSISFTQTVVSSASPTPGSGWAFSTVPDGMLQFVTGPETPPLGCGSVQFSHTLPTGKATLYNYDYKGTELSDITRMVYWSYRHGISNNPEAQTIAFQIEIDANGAAPGGTTTLVFEPVYQSGGVEAIEEDEWQQWDALQGGNAIWWSTRDIDGVCAFVCYVTWNQILEANPDAVVSGGLGFNTGSGWHGTFVGNADALTFGVSGRNTTYNFEPSADSDGDGGGDACDTDDDNDGIPDNQDCDPTDPKKDKVIVCHNGREICVSKNAVAAHLAHGDNVGPCPMMPVTQKSAPGTTVNAAIPENFTMGNYPNPFVGTTKITYSLPADSRVLIRIYDAGGREVAVRNQGQQKAGNHSLNFDAGHLRPGVYYYRLFADGSERKPFRGVQKMIIKN